MLETSCYEMSNVAPRYILALLLGFSWLASFCCTDGFTGLLCLYNMASKLNLRLGIWEDSNSRTKDTTLFPMELLFSALNLPTPRQPAGLPRKTCPTHKAFDYQAHQAQPPTNTITKAPCVLVWRRLFKSRVLFSCARAALRVEHFFPSGANPYTWAWMYNSPNSSTYPKPVYSRETREAEADHAESLYEVITFAPRQVDPRLDFPPHGAQWPHQTTNQA